MKRNIFGNLEGAGENHTDSIEDFQDLMDAWKELSVILMSN